MSIWFINFLFYKLFHINNVIVCSITVYDSEEFIKFIITQCALLNRCCIVHIKLVLYCDKTFKDQSCQKLKKE